MSILRVALLLFALSSSLLAQFSYGFGTQGAAGLFPQLSCGRLTASNGGFGFTINNATGGSSAFFALSIGQANTSLGALPIWVDLAPTSLVDFRTLTLNGSFGVPGAGSTFLPYPVVFPPQLAGLDVYAQAVVVDALSGAPASTRGLRVELALEPMVFVGTSVGGSNDPTWVLDSQTPAISQSLSSGTDNVSGADWGLGGSRVYASTSLGGTVAELDMAQPTPAWTNFWVAGGSCYGIGVDTTNDIVYTLSDGPTGSRELYALDGDPASATYGQVLNSTSALTTFGFVERMTISKETLQVAVLTVFSSRALIVDINPASPTYMTWRDLGAVPAAAGSAFTIATNAAFDAQGLSLIVNVQLAGPVPGEIARYSFVTQSWIDHDLATAAIDNIGANSVPIGTVPGAPTGISMAKSGQSAAISGFGNNGSLVRLDLDPSNPFFWSTTQLVPPGSIPGAWACSYVNEDSEIAVGSFGGAGGALFFFNALTGAQRARIPLPGASNVYTVISN